MSLAVERISVRARDRVLVDQVSFEVGAGEIVAVIGPNGAGKTSLLEAVVGLLPASGVVRVDGKLVRSFREHADAFAFAPDDAMPPPETLVSTLVEHARDHRPRETFDAIGKAIGIGPLSERPAGVLSRGEKKRLALFLALAAERPVLVLDEPFGAFDPLQLRDVLEVVRSVARSGAAVVVSIHQLGDAERIADRILLLREGRALAFGKVEAIRGAGSLEEAFLALLAKDRPNAS